MRPRALPIEPRGEYVVQQLQAAAEQSQKSTLAELAQHHTKFQPFWIVNTIHAGIFPVFSNGNMGPLCQSATTPGGYTESYSVGAFDQYD